MRPLIAALLVLAACSGESAVGSSSTTTTVGGPAEPDAALELYLSNIARGEGAPVIDDRQIVLLAGAEGASTDEIADLFTSIGSGRVAVNFWEGFADGVLVDAIDIDDLRFGQIREFRQDGLDRASVDVWDSGREGVRVFHLASVDGQWTIDLFATFGDVYAGPLRLLVRSLDPGADGFSAVADALKAQAPSLELAPSTDARLEISSDLAELP